MDARRFSNNVNKITLKSVLQGLRVIVIIPLAPIALIIIFFFGWALKIHSKIPEDLDDQLPKKKF